VALHTRIPKVEPLIHWAVRAVDVALFRTSNVQTLEKRGLTVGTAFTRLDRTMASRAKPLTGECRQLTTTKQLSLTNAQRGHARVMYRWIGGPPRVIPSLACRIAHLAHPTLGLATSQTICLQISRVPDGGRTWACASLSWCELGLTCSDYPQGDGAQNFQLDLVLTRRALGGFIGDINGNGVTVRRLMALTFCLDGIPVLMMRSFPIWTMTLMEQLSLKR